MPYADIKHGKISLVEREKLDELAKSEGISVCKLLMRWYLDPDTAPIWFLRAMSAARYRILGRGTFMAKPPKVRHVQASLAANTRYAEKRWGGSVVKMRRDWAKLRKQAGADKYDAAAVELGINPASYIEAGPEAYGAFIRLRDHLGLKPKRVRKKGNPDRQP